MAYVSPIHIPDVEIMVYLGILDTRKYFGSQKILTEITTILSWILLWWEKCGYFVVKMAMWEKFCPKFFIKGLNNVSCHSSMKMTIFYSITVTLPHRTLHFYAYFMLFLRLWVPHCRRKLFRQIPGYQKAENYFQVWTSVFFSLILNCFLSVYFPRVKRSSCR